MFQQRNLRRCLHVARQQGVPLSRWLVTVEVARQAACLWRRRGSASTPAQQPVFDLARVYRCSTSRFGTGQTRGSNRTPLGLHRIAVKIGGGWPIGTVFRDRRPVGFTWCGVTFAPIAHRVLWLEGLEPGFNRGGTVDSFDRYIYLHGLGDETTLGRPASIGCIHLAAADLLPLYDLLPTGALVWIGEH